MGALRKLMTPVALDTVSPGSWLECPVVCDNLQAASETYQRQGVVHEGTNAKVCDLGISLQAQQHICWLDVPVHLQFM